MPGYRSYTAQRLAARAELRFEHLQDEEQARVSTAAQRFDAHSTEAAPPAPAEEKDHLLDSMPWLPCTVTVDIPVARFTIGDLLGLTKGAIVETDCRATSDLPLRVNNLLIGWTEFNVVGDRLAVRITEQV